MKIYSRLIISLFIVFVLFGCAAKEPILSPMQKRHITTKLIEGSYDHVYRATLTVLQDQGYIIKNTDMASGLIVSNADRPVDKGNQFAQAFWLGYVPNKGTAIEITCLINKLNATSTEIRMNIREVKYGQSSAWSSSGKQDTKQIYDETIYQSLFNEITLETKRRVALSQ